MLGRRPRRDRRRRRSTPRASPCSACSPRRPQRCAPSAAATPASSRCGSSWSSAAACSGRASASASARSACSPRRWSPAASGRGCRSRCSAPPGSASAPACCRGRDGRRELGLLAAYSAVVVHRLRLPAQPVVLAVPHHRLGLPAGAVVRARCARGREPAALDAASTSPRRSASTSRARSLTVALVLVAGRPVLARAAPGVAARRVRRARACSTPRTCAGDGSWLLGTGSADGWPNAWCTLRLLHAGRDGPARSARPPPRSSTTCCSLDCGPDTPRRPSRAGVPLAGVPHVLLTHAHPDHLAPLALLARSWARPGASASRGRAAVGDRRVPRLGRPRRRRDAS